MGPAAQRMKKLGSVIAPPIITGLAYYIVAVTALGLTLGHDGIAAIWPSSGILLAALLISPRSMAGWHIGAAAVASLAANIGLNNSALVSTGFTIANIAESSLAAWLILRRRGDHISWSDPAPLGWFCLAATCATFVSASIALCFVQPPTAEFWFSWFSTDLLGILIVTPLIMIVRDSFRAVAFRPSPAAIGKVISVFTLQAALCVVTFAQSTYPLLFLPMIGVLIAVFRLGPLGAAGSVLMITVASSLAIIMDTGPVALIHASIPARSLFLQAYLLALFAAALPVAALLASGKRLQVQLRENLRLLQLAESSANVGQCRPLAARHCDRTSHLVA